ncbi:hypothetical protein [Actinopolymorpha rutila]|uniref:Uncharacterized protein n=1 Tax=Actinopolymorpha rutila TaxID=446787 RepID=A0A852Z755_9ACTN|nr:hypothetical protein [Actinopolymorpha rutila]NYH89107.1 hypothetical protein [Actinopolymorpha rutila]
MHSTTQDLPGAGGSGAVGRLRAALATIRAGVEEALATPTTWVEVGELGALIGELEAEKARTDALTLAWVRQAEAGDIGKTTGAATAAGGCAARSGCRRPRPPPPSAWPGTWTVRSP